MGKKRKHSETTHDEAQPQKEDVTPERPARTLLGWKDKNEVTNEVEDNSPIFRNREKVLVTCSRRINYRYNQIHNPYFVVTDFVCLFGV